MLGAELIALSLVHERDIPTVDLHLSGRGPADPGNDVQERSLAAPALPHHDNLFPDSDVELVDEEDLQLAAVRLAERFLTSLSCNMLRLIKGTSGPPGTGSFFGPFDCRARVPRGLVRQYRERTGSKVPLAPDWLCWPKNVPLSVRPRSAACSLAALGAHTQLHEEWFENQRGLRLCRAGRHVAGAKRRACRPDRWSPGIVGVPASAG